MKDQNQGLWLHITAGQGPAECAWAVVKVLEQIQKEAVAASLQFRTLEIQSGAEPGTAHSALISISRVSISGPAALQSFAASWIGTVQWTARMPFRPLHKRKNWFVGIDVFEPVDETSFSPQDIRWEAMRASGPGGQRVNKTESAIRVIHMPTGTEATATEERSQHRNRKLALARLIQKLNQVDAKRFGEARHERWRAHQELQRGNPVRVLRADER